MTEHHDSSPADPVTVTSDPDAVAKAHEVMSSMDIAMLTTVDSSSPDGRLTSRPLSTQVHEEDGDVLFLVRSSSAVADDVRANAHVNVAYSSRKAWVSLAGTATVVDDRALVQQLWSKGADASWKAARRTRTTWCSRSTATPSCTGAATRSSAQPSTR
ncbi:hypothetical protein BJF80_00910 [Serinicoccus sp. CUA-874]|uniref:pyridoxamine 5'-phosphate oxidase family protein n=1 Tax=Serinicoccus sp. CUA-874 TaxID=1517939 RepID=UPI00095E5EA4|nr:pyridoxamine 5'-phosphate oxidase family protein [Serinicoccus sp. CUA-874]OLT17909.1 hypothetical protein BJF80_00910 [Serinicoccus sp. CUA-874]